MQTEPLKWDETFLDRNTRRDVVQRSIELVELAAVVKIRELFKRKQQLPAPSRESKFVSMSVAITERRPADGAGGMCLRRRCY